MNTQRTVNVERVGEVVGFVAGYLLFSSIVHFVFFFMGKMSPSWMYIYTLLLCAGIAGFGSIIMRWLR